MDVQEVKVKLNLLVQPHFRTLFSSKKEQITDTHNHVDESPGNYAEWKQPIPLGHILYDSIYVTFLRRQNWNGDTIGSCEELRKKWWEGSRCGYKRAIKRDPCDGNALYLNCINVKILVEILYYSFARYYHERKLGKEYRRSLCTTTYK